MCFKEKMTAYFSIKRRCCCCSAKVKNSSISWAEGIFLRIKFLLLWVVFNSVRLVAEPGLTISSTSLTRLQGVLSLVLLIIHIHNYRLQDHMQVMSERKKEQEILLEPQQIVIYRHLIFHNNNNKPSVVSETGSIERIEYMQTLSVHDLPYPQKRDNEVLK